MYIMVYKNNLKSSVWKVFEIFVDEPLTIHYVKEISRRISLSPPSVRKHVGDLENQNLIMKKKGERFIGFIANRDNESFIFFKKMFNMMKLKESEVVEFISNSMHPQAIVLYGSYAKGEDVEKSDIDIFILSKIKKNLDFGKYENLLKRKIHIINEERLNKLQKNLEYEIINGIVLKGYLKN
ncbi:hypothetical protein COU57_02995 [Candidatus Pacearchaeota archaeon CG10_big_fil_rev_8_21_14_0_10_32_14]|nr:MAG: hypothetical protein COU57_02995 [Candidatus Pacearchaeota archaeon CG10_big_fil_rev_8_21_14_0_10_32_14]